MKRENTVCFMILYVDSVILMYIFFQFLYKSKVLEIGIISVALKAFSIGEFAVLGHSLHTTIPFPSTVYKSSVLTAVN